MMKIMKTTVDVKLAILLIAGIGSCLGFRGISDETQVDTHEGSTVNLQCRFPPPRGNATCFWLSHTNNAHDNAAIGDASLAPYYKVSMNLDEGVYDLKIFNVSYERDNGKYECRVKAIGSGENLFHKNVTLTVLRAPSPPVISPAQAVAKEGEKIELNCNTHGGSPEPEVKWFKGNNTYSVLHTGKTYVLIPSKEDDRTIFRCTVRNRAMPSSETLQATVKLDVQYYPRVSIGSENPMRIEMNSTAILKCNVDAKPAVTSVRWLKDGSFVSTSFSHVISKVTMQDAGRYTCQADNGLNRKGESFLTLDVLYPPQVYVEGSSLRTVDVEDTVNIHCNVSANPKPTLVEWLRDGRPEFRQHSPILRLPRLAAEHAGNYTCRASNVIHPSNGSPRTHSAEAKVEIRVRHRPGPARITPDSPIATENNKVILTCIANPPGYPEPTFQWSREGEIHSIYGQNEHQGPKLEIMSVRLGSEGTYKCQASNEIGRSEPASVNLTVYQAPKILTKLQPQVTKKVGESSFQVSCVAQGKPRPTVRWLKDDRELTADESLYRVITTHSEGHGRVVIVNSTLRFLGNARSDTDKIIASDRGKYSCYFDNQVKHAESEMMLKVEHAPIVNPNSYGKVASNLGETANVTCEVQAWPKAEFQWSFGNNAATLQGSTSDGHYEIFTTSHNYDTYTSTLRISRINESDYGDYSCRAANVLGSITTTIKLQPKGPPEKPTAVRAMNVGPNFVALVWELNFDGGLPLTKYFVSYRRIASAEDIIAPDCRQPRGPVGSWQEVDCQKSNPCNVSGLEQHQTYAFKVKVYNTFNHSDYSDEVTATTSVAKIPSPVRVTYEPENQMLAIDVARTCLALIASIEKYDDELERWREVDDWTLDVLGGSSTTREGMLNHDFLSSRTRARLCLKASLKSDSKRCGEYVEATIGPSFIAQANALDTPTFIALVVSGAVCFLFAALLLLFCRCRRKHAAKAKDYEMDSNAVRPSLVTGNGQPTQAPPPYYAENKALEHGLDHQLTMEDSKTPAYGQTGYGYHQPSHNLVNGVNLGYMENSYTNSNNGGSVNSQDSIWQMKSAAAANGINPQYDMGGYMPTETDYPTHNQHYMTQNDYRDAHNLSRQQFCEPFGTVVSSQNHVDLQYDVSGLPYQESYDDDGGMKPPQQVTMSYDENMESGYSTPNSRGRRIIREIIV